MNHSEGKKTVKEQFDMGMLSVVEGGVCVCVDLMAIVLVLLSATTHSVLRKNRVKWSTRCAYIVPHCRAVVVGHWMCSRVIPL
jgi:hypothetical protein